MRNRLHCGSRYVRIYGFDFATAASQIDATDIAAIKSILQRADHSSSSHYAEGFFDGLI